MYTEQSIAYNELNCTLYKCIQYNLYSLCNTLYNYKDVSSSGAGDSLETKLHNFSTLNTKYKYCFDKNNCYCTL